MKKLHFFSKKIITRFLIGSFLEFAPVLIFLFSFEYFHIYKATLLLMIATIVSTVTTYLIQKRLPYVALYVAFLTSIFGLVTLLLHEPKFIQMRDTLYDLTCALTLVFGIVFNVPVLKLAFNSVLPMKNESWRVLTYYWTVFFLSAALLNEYIRKAFSLETWFDYKSVIVVVTVVFGLIALYYVYEKE